MAHSAFDGSVGRHQRLADNLAAEDPLPAHLWAQAPEEIVLECFKVEDRQEFVESAAHGPALAFRVCRSAAI